jgi:3-oxoadipate enol-lactonase
MTRPDVLTTTVQSAVHTTVGDGGARIAYQDSGGRDQRAMVLLHSLGADRRMWDACLPLLPGDVRLVAPDTRGHGGSAATGQASVSVWVEDLRAVLAAASISRAFIVGVSLGGIQALAFAARYPELVEGLVVADSFAVLEPSIAERKIAELCGRARSVPMEVVAEEYLAATFQRPYPPGAESVRRAIAGMVPESYIAAVSACFGVDIAAQLAAVAAPTLVLWGDRDQKSPRGLSEDIARGVPGGVLSVVPDAGHLSNIDNPAGFCRAVAEFHQRVSSTSSAESGFAKEAVDHG